METSRGISLATSANHIKISSGNSRKKGSDNFLIFFKGELSTGFTSLPYFNSSKVTP